MIFNALHEKTSKVFAKLSDLAKYLPLTGGKVTGNIEVTSDGVKDRDITLSNSKRKVISRVSDGGVYVLHDVTNGKRIIESTANGTNTFNGTASGNLPLTSGSAKTLEVRANTVLKVNNTGGGDYTWLQFLNGDTTLGYIGYNKNKVPLVSIDGTPSTLLHTGNSAKVVVSSTAPSDTSALWVY